jgi:CheY-like chemotaxis protein
MRRASLDLFQAATTAADALAEAWGGAGVAFALAWGAEPQLEVLYCRGLREEVCHALAEAPGRRLTDALRREREPVILHRSRLAGETAGLRDVLEAGGLAGLLLVPAAGPRGATGVLCLELTEEQMTLDDGNATLALAVVDQVGETLRGLALAASASALALALAESCDAVPAPDGVVVLDRWDRVLLAFGAPQDMQGWYGGAFGLAADEIPGGPLLSSLPLSSAGQLVWEEHLFPPLEGEGIPVSLAAVPFAARGDGESGRIVLIRDLRVEPASRDLSPLLALALRAASDVEVLDMLDGSGDTGEASPMIRRLQAFRSHLLQQASSAPRTVEEALLRTLGPEAEWRTDLHAMLEEVVQDQEREMLAEGVRILRFLRPDLGPVPGHPVQLQRILGGLVDWARHSLRPRGGTLTLRSWEENDQVYLAVSDDGTGVHGETGATAFVPLYTDVSPEARQQEFVEWARTLVEPWGGRLLVENRPGIWNRCTLMLPALAPATAPADMPPAVEVQQADDGLQVLVVDDNPSLRSVMRRYLERRGHKVTEAEDGAVALELIESRAFDRVVVDIRMPGTDGPTFFANLDRVAPELRDRTIFMTGGFTEASVEDFIHGTGRPAIQKPFDLGEMARTVES